MPNQLLHLFCALALQQPGTAAQDPAETAPPVDPAKIAAIDEDARERFAGMRTTRKAALVARIRGRLFQLADPAYARITALKLDPYELDEIAPSPTFDPTPHGLPARQPVGERDTAHRRLRVRFARTSLLGDLHQHVVYDWCRGAVVAADSLDYSQIFDNLLRGYPPEVDHAVASVQAALDTDSRMRKLAHWFGHTYADLESRAYEGLTLYDAWYSGEPVAVPDVDAIPFAHEILGLRSMQTPLSGKPRARLYEAIKQDALLYRKYRTLREAAAAAFVSDDPPMDAIYARLVPRFHVILAQQQDDLTAVAKLLDRRDRDSLIEKIDREVSAEDSEAFRLREARRTELATMRARVRRFALEELERFVPSQR